MYYKACFFLKLKFYLFKYTVQSGEQDLDGIQVGSINLNGTQLEDSAGNSANLTLNSIGSTAAVLVDALPEVNLSSSGSPILFLQRLKVA